MNITNEMPFIPSELLRLKKPPKRLFYRGNLEFLKMPKIAIVGSRNMSIYTKNLIVKTATMLKNNGICVVSGAALGCDITAQISAFPHTISVFGNGLDIIYPKQNATQISQIYENALAISEYKDGTKPFASNFLERNRITIGLCEAVIIAQADIKSGSISSARIANAINIPVYVFPHRIDESSGTNALLREKNAEIVDNIDLFVSKICENFKIKTLPLKFENDEILEFIRGENSLAAALLKFGEKIYEYELEGKIEILGTKVAVK